MPREAITERSTGFGAHSQEHKRIIEEAESNSLGIFNIESGGNKSMQVQDLSYQQRQNNSMKSAQGKRTQGALGGPSSVGMTGIIQELPEESLSQSAH